MNKSVKTLLSLCLPGILLILAYLCLVKINSMSALVIGIIPFLPYLLLLIAGVLAYRFNQSKIFYMALAFIFIQLTIEVIIGQRYLDDGGRVALIYSLIGILVPLNILIYCFLKERGIFSLWGLVKLLFIIGQFLGAAWIVSSAKPEVLNIVNAQLLPWNFEFMQGIAQLSLLVFCLSVIAILIQLRLNHSYFSTTAIGVLFSVALLTHFRNLPLVAPIFMSSAGLMMIICIIQNSYSMAYLDELTEIPGRRALREDMMKLSGSYVMAMVDIDFFKKFNDKYGHDVGDDVLRMVASKLDRVTGGGKAYRYGGEEFVIIFSGKKLVDVLSHLEKLRENIAKSQFSIRGQDRPKKKAEKIKPAQPVRKTSVKVSIGVAEKNRPREKAQEVLKSADEALYRAKKKGRNRVCE